MALTFRTRLTLWYVATLSLLLGLTAVALVYSLDRIAQNKFDAALWMLGAAEAEGISASLHRRGLDRPDNESVINSRYRELLGYENGRLEEYVTVIDDNRRVADFTSNLSAPLPIDETLLSRSLAGETVYQTVKVNGVGLLRVIYMPVRGSAVPHTFVVVVGLPEAFIGTDVRSFNILVMLGFVTLLLLTGASAMLLADRVIKPIEEITAAAESISAANLGTGLPDPHTRDQIGRLSAVFNQVLSRLDAAFEAQRHFTSRAAHELRTPLTILKGETQVALRRRRTFAEYEALLNSNLEEIDKLVMMIDDLLLLARYEGGEADFPREPVRLDELVASVRHDLQKIISDNEIDLQIRAESLSVNGDAKALERLFYNLLENALVYTGHGGRVVVQIAREGERINLIVEDNGVGIPPEELPHIRERFYRSSRAREIRPEGSGIGLAMTDVIARLHGATIKVTSEPGLGTRFVVSFPG